MWRVVLVNRSKTWQVAYRARPIEGSDGPGQDTWAALQLCESQRKRDGAESYRAQVTSRRAVLERNSGRAVIARYKPGWAGLTYGRREPITSRRDLNAFLH